MDSMVACYDCGSSYELIERKRCECGEPLWFESSSPDFSWSRVQDVQGMWRYADLLPVTEPQGIGAAAGGTSLTRTQNLDDFAGCELYLKNEAENPTGAFKDRGSAVGISYALEAGSNWVGTVSQGNMAMSMSANAASTELRCMVFVPKRIPSERLDLIGQYDPEIVIVDGDYGQLYYDTTKLEVDVEFVNSDTPLRIAGQKTAVLEICEFFAPSTPDAIVLPVSSGGHASAAWKALYDLDQAGLIDDLPQIHLVQAAACDPIASAYRNGEKAVAPGTYNETIAVSIANSSPPSGNRTLAAIRATGGSVVSVDDDAIRESITKLSREAGLCVEPSSATVLAGLKEVSDNNNINKDDSVVAIITGTGFKEFHTAFDITRVNTRETTLSTLKEDVNSIVEGD